MSQETEDNRLAYLAEITEWVRHGRNTRRPSPLQYGLLTGDFTSSEIHEAENKGDPQPDGVSTWIWLDHTKPDQKRWHEILRAVANSATEFTSAELRKAENLYGNKSC